MAKTMLDLSAAHALVDAKRAKDIFLDCPNTFRQKVKEIREQVEKGRYSRYSVLDDGRLKVNFYVYYDYCKHRAWLNDKYASKSVPPFSPQEIAEVMPAPAECSPAGGMDRLMTQKQEEANRALREAVREAMESHRIAIRRDEEIMRLIDKAGEGLRCREERLNAGEGRA